MATQVRSDFSSLNAFNCRRNNGSNETTSAPNVTAAMDNYILRQCFKLISAHGTQILNFTIIREGIPDMTGHMAEGWVATIAF